jgi:hypothetical protein
MRLSSGRFICKIAFPFSGSKASFGIVFFLGHFFTMHDYICLIDEKIQLVIRNSTSFRI